MDGFQNSMGVESVVAGALLKSSAVSEPAALRARPARVEIRRWDGLDTLVVTKTVAGFDAACVETIGGILQDAAAGRLGALKFLVFDFAHAGAGESIGAEGFAALAADAANLILKAPVVTVACARAHIEGADMEFALACSMMIGEEGAQFSFAADPLQSIGAYGLLAQKIGFVRAEMLMESSQVLSPQDMQSLMLLKTVADVGAGDEGIEAFVRRTARRHNSCVGIYRAQRIATPIVGLAG